MDEPVSNEQLLEELIEVGYNGGNQEIDDAIAELNDDPGNVNDPLNYRNIIIDYINNNRQVAGRKGKRTKGKRSRKGKGTKGKRSRKGKRTKRSRKSSKSRRSRK